MSRKSGKLNIIDHNTYEDLKHEHGEPSLKFLRNSKYKNKHKKDAQCSLLDFLVVPRKKPKQPNKKKRPHLIVARNSYTFQAKRKGKTRLNPKHRVTRLKRIIKRFRQMKLQSSEQNIGAKLLEPTGNLSNFVALSTSTVAENSFSNSVAEHSLLDRVPAGRTVVENSLPSSVAAERTVVENSLSNSVAAGNGKAQTGNPSQIHSRRFRSYCDNCTTKRLKELTTLLLNDLERFQKRAYSNNEIKARAHPRLVVGFREAFSRLRINKVKLLLLAPDCEACAGEGGLDDTIEELKSLCQKQEVPYCFSLMRRELSYALHKRAQISCVAILDYDGSNDTYKQLIQELNESRIQYKQLTAM